MDTGTNETQVNVQYGTLLEITEALRERDARIESLSAEVEARLQDASAAWDKCEERRIAQEKAEARVRALEEALREAKIVAHAGRPIGGIVLVSQEYMLKRIVAIADRALTENTNG